MASYIFTNGHTSQPYTDKE